MPIPIRRFHIQKINEYQKEQEEKADRDRGAEPLTKELTNIPKEALVHKKPSYSTNVKPKK